MQGLEQSNRRLCYTAPMLNFSHLSLRRGKHELLHDVTCTVQAGQKVGITGANGVGKSSLFALILNELQPDAGEFSLPPNTVIAHVAQEMPAADKSALEYVIDGDTRLRDIEQQIRDAEQQNRGEQLARLHSELEHIDGYSAASRAGKLLHGLGFSAEQESVPVREFSGGWRMRLNLAQALMCRSDLLLLDEPTNHLDLEAVVWLEEWLRAYPGTLLLISHDRDFLDRVTTHIAHIEQCRMTLYTGNYSAFEVLRAQQLANQQSAYEKQQREIAHIQKYIDRFRAQANKARQAQSRIKALERMEVISQAHVDSPFHFSFRTPNQLPNPLLQLDEVAIGYAKEPVLNAVKLTIAPGDRIGLLGYNGAGKSTLIKSLAGELKPLMGETTPAKGLEVGYFAQHQLEQLDPQASPLLHLQRIDPKASEQSLRNYLGGFGFGNEMAVSPVAPFSGGEKSRLVLAMLVYQKPNLLLLDEPTNHLDLEMRHALTLALQEFDGAMVVVSHDRYLLRSVADSLLLVADGNVSRFDGDLDDYRQWVQQQEKAFAADARGNKTTPGLNKKQQRQQAAEQRRQIQPLRNKVKKLEQQMETLTSRQAELHDQLADTRLYEEQNKTELQELLAQQAELQQQQQAVEAQWLSVNEEIEMLEQAGTG
ncbi:ATP-binding cassette subfamily F protein 3 [Thiohalophilus thiocyanatoxydans]|uniref:Probable ATP-binding protein YheS n=2 Tax=Thiohalophilus thiocyanatoxydans TaxID=381308 RepID=A0A4R8IFH4_9GAMM|nr:ATP-binding cassette subfamily F protein 3 [Thiohalophilus thiocyanatoxydans]